MSGLRVLVVDDDVAILRAVRRGLEAHGYRVDVLQSGAEVLTEFRRSRPDVILLDLLLPDADGVDLCRAIRAEANVPVIVLSAVGDDRRKVQALDEGADDYLVKPFELAELQARLRALLRRSKGAAGPLLQHGRVALDPASHVVFLDGTPVELSAREFATLQELMMNAGKVRTRSQLEDSLYGWGEEIESNAVSVYIHQLRRKLGADFIRTVRGVGYFVSDAHSAGPVDSE